MRYPSALFPLAAVVCIFFTINSVSAQGTAFTYQGVLKDGLSPANGSYDLTFGMWNAASAGTQQGNLLTNSATTMSNGLFMVTLDFGNQFPSADRWLEIGLRTNGGGAFTVLIPRQPITPTPYAIYSANAGSAVTANSATTAGSANSVSAANITGTVSLAQLPTTIVTNNQSGVNLNGSFAGDGASLTNLNAVAKTGDTMTGRLNLPANGLVAGGSQLVLTNGNLGIATATPMSPLQLGSIFAFQQDVNSGYIGANFGNGTGGNYIKSQYANQILFDSFLGNINFNVAPSGTAGNTIAYTRAMVINSTGKVGIGTASPISKLSVAMSNSVTSTITTQVGLGANAITLQGGEPNGLDTKSGLVASWHTSPGIASGLVFGRYGTAWGTYIGFHTHPDNLNALDDFTEKMRIDGNGNVGIGTMNPASPLQLGSVFAFQQDVNSGYIGANFGNGTGGSYLKSQYANQIHFDTFYGNINFNVAPSGTAGNTISYTRAMVINSTGNVGIGTNNPQSMLHVNGTVTAVNFIGNGAGLTNLPASQPAMSAPTPAILSGSGTYTTPANVRRLYIRMIGGGGGGGGGTIPNGTAGGNSTFNSIVAKGGSTATYSYPILAGGAGGSGGAGTAFLRIKGGNGASTMDNSGTSDYGGAGGNGAFGGGGQGATIGTTVAATAGAANSGGGGGGSGDQAPGGGGGAGEYVEIYLTPTALQTFAYSVGAGGSGSSNTFAGGVGAAGGSGVIIVTEIY